MTAHEMHLRHLAYKWELRFVTGEPVSTEALTAAKYQFIALFGIERLRQVMVEVVNEARREQLNAHAR